jgi:hypothetical protein
VLDLDPGPTLFLSASCRLERGSPRPHPVLCTVWGCPRRKEVVNPLRSAGLARPVPVRISHFLPQGTRPRESQNGSAPAPKRRPTRRHPPEGSSWKGHVSPRFSIPRVVRFRLSELLDWRLEAQREDPTQRHPPPGKARTDALRRRREGPTRGHPPERRVCSKARLQAHSPHSTRNSALMRTAVLRHRENHHRLRVLRQESSPRPALLRSAEAAKRSL